MPQSKLLRELGVFSATAIVVSNMIGTGIFTTTGFLAGDLGSAWLVVAIWFAGAVLALAGALCYSELGINFPRSGGEYVPDRSLGTRMGLSDRLGFIFCGFFCADRRGSSGRCRLSGLFLPGSESE